MQITDIRIRHVSSEGKMKARVSLTIDDQFVIHEIKIIQGKNGLFVAMPSKELPNGEFRDIAHPITKEARSLIQDSILNTYEKELEEITKNPVNHDTSNLDLGSDIPCDSTI